MKFSGEKIHGNPMLVSDSGYTVLIKYGDKVGADGFSIAEICWSDEDRMMRENPTAVWDKFWSNVPDEIQFLVSLTGKWVLDVPPGLTPDLYGTGTYEGDLEIAERFKTIMEKYNIQID